ncbi:MAG: hypothetical protein V1720_11995 [bacterium]
MTVIKNIQKEFPHIRFDSFEAEHDPELCGDIDYFGWVGDKAFGIQIKPITAESNFGNYSVTERMKESFNDFIERFGGKVFIVFSLDGEIGNTSVLDQFKEEIARLRSE